MSNEVKSNRSSSKKMDHYNEKFLATKENRKKVKEAFDKSKKKSMKGDFDQYMEV
ncbi:hypothetical protein [Sessilibacter corallicola]|uniref:Uncharacterized protein n=1 Tax=Sessilibacter corallicola TaxID=2904075 RepID=A0ABQ0A9B3_9GAMM